MSLRHLTVRVYSHGFCAFNLSPRGKWICRAFSRNFVQYGFVPHAGHYQKVGVKVFAAATENHAEFRFHINALDKFKEFLITNNVDDQLVNWEIAPMYEPQAARFDVKEGWVAKEHQPSVIEYLSKDGPLSKFVDLQTGKGKSLSLDELVKIPGGWKRMGDIQVGDIVTAKDGTPTKVIGVYPQGKVQLYRIVFEDGRSTECCAEHLWGVYYGDDETPQVINTLEVLRLASMQNLTVQIDTAESEQGEDAPLPVDPYLLGFLLGNPTRLSAERKRKGFLKLLLGDTPEIPARDILSVHGIVSDKPWEINIPKEYLFASHSQRLTLMQGLLDGNTHTPDLDASKEISFITSSSDLVKNVVYLARSFGAKAKISVENCDYKALISFKTPRVFFRLEKNQAAFEDTASCLVTNKLKVISVEESSLQHAQCISVDHVDKLYVTTDFIVTHNTFCSLQAVANRGLRVGVIVKPMYIEKWVADFKKTYDIEPEDIIVIKGSSQLMALLDMAKNGLIKAKAVIISNKTYQNWIKLYEKYHVETLDMGYACAPQDFFELLKIGIRLIDEVHQDFHLNFKIDLYTHCPNSISLSATLINNDPFMEKMYELAYPAQGRFRGLALDKYIDSFAVHYRFHKPEMIRTEEFGGRGYSHGALEKSVMKHYVTLNNYLSLIQHIIDISFLKVVREKKKLIVFAASIAMCTEMTQHFSRRFPHLKIKRYVEDDDYQNLFDSDICFTTLLSAGTAHDVPDLTTVILTVAVDSVQANVQSLGRLRKLNDSPTEFYYLVCSDFPKHMTYHERKVQMLEKRAKSFRDIFTGYRI